MAIDGKVPEQNSRRWLLARALRMTFWVIYDHLGGIVQLNVITVVAFALPAWLLWACLGLPGEIVWVALLVYVVGVYTGQCYLMSQILSGKPFGFRLLQSGVGRFAFGGLILALAMGVPTVMSLFGIWFYGTLMASPLSLMGMVLAQVCACTVLFVLMAAFYTWPAFIARSGRLLEALQTGVTLVVIHPVASAGFIGVALICGAFAVTPPGCLLLSTFPLVTFASCAYELLARLHDAPCAISDQDDIYLNRGVRDFLFPWKG